MDKLFDSMDDHPIATIVGIWLVGSVVSLAMLAAAVFIIVKILSGMGVI